MNIRQVEEILNAFPLAPKPKYVFMINEPVYESFNGVALYKGLTPKWRRDLIVLTSLATPETVVHEFLHTLGFGEVIAYTISKPLSLISNFRVFPRFVEKKTQYEVCTGECEFQKAHELGILHYRLI